MVKVNKPFAKKITNDIIKVLEKCTNNFVNRHQLADTVLKITFSVSKIVGRRRMSPDDVAGHRRTSPDVAGRRRTSPDVAVPHLAL